MFNLVSFIKFKVGATVIVDFSDKKLLAVRGTTPTSAKTS